jgi:hypothetical protein
VWLHLSAVVVWAFVGLLFGVLLLAGKAVPPVVVIACGGAALGHLVFLATHLYLARMIRRRAESRPDAT